MNTGGPGANPRANKFPGRCRVCGERVIAGAGYLTGRDPASGTWTLECIGCLTVADPGPDDDPVTNPADSWEAVEARMRADAECARREREARTDREREESLRRGLDDLERLRLLNEELNLLLLRQRPREPECLKILGLRPPVTPDMVNRRFRELAKTKHPDLGGDADQFIAPRAARDQALSIARANS